MFIGILGGGLSGVSLQRFLSHDSEVLEKEERIGGLCRTFCKDRFYYDIGGHILFSRDSQIIGLLKQILSENIVSCRRNNKILFKGKYVKYPFENGLGALDKQDIYECLIGYIKNSHPEPVNFKEWTYYTFGKGIAEKYLIPYNQKIWKFPLEQIGLDWVSRIPRPPLEDIVRSSLGIETEGYLHQLYFNYPKTGGIEALVKALAQDSSKIVTGFEVNAIEKKGNKWVVSDGRHEKQYDKLVLTIPVNEAVRYIPNVPRRVLDVATSLKYNSVRIVLVGINNDSLLDKSALYLPDNDTVFHRLCYMGYFSKNMVPDRHSSIVAEITTRKNHELYDISDSGLIQRVVDDLCKIGIIDKQSIVTTDILNIEYAYVLPDLNQGENMEIIREFLSSIGIELLGRFAEFEYINMDETINRSLNMARKLNEAN